MPNADYLDGQLLIAMPGMGDPRFDHAVIYMCAHSPEGAMGLVVNKLADQMTFPDLLDQLDIPVGNSDNSIQVHFGGPVEESRGFVLHSNDYSQDGSMPVDENMALTASVDVLRAMSVGEGPIMSMLALGYAGWGPGQLDAEIQANAWLHIEYNDDLVFGNNQESKWSQAVTMLGIDLTMLFTTAGHA